MKKFEIESLIKSFLLFFLSIEIFLVVILYLGFQKKVDEIYHSIHNEMRVCNLELNCEDRFDISFSEDTYPKDTLQIVDKNIFTLFQIDSEKYSLKIEYKTESFEQDISSLIKNAITIWAISSFFIAILSFLFSIFALNPLRKAINLNEEFMKDIIHDFNTPISSIMINLEMLKNQFGANRKIERAEISIQKLLSLQENLKTYLKSSKGQIENFKLHNLVNERVDYISNIYPKIIFTLDIEELEIYSHKDSVARIIDNIIDNSCKYGNGKISVILKNRNLIISDNGTGIKNIKKVFQRFYKETERGIGLGLNIVKKLSDEIGLKLNVKSSENGTEFKIIF